MAESSLTPTQLAQVIRVCEAFEAAWKSGNNVQIQTYVDILSDGLFERELFRELVAVEVQLHARRGDWPSGAEYKERFPGHSTIIESVFATACMPSGGSGPPPERMRSAPGPGKNLLGRYEILGELGRGHGDRLSSPRPATGRGRGPEDATEGRSGTAVPIQAGVSEAGVGRTPELGPALRTGIRRTGLVPRDGIDRRGELPRGHPIKYAASPVGSTAVGPAGSARFGHSLAGMPSPRRPPTSPRGPGVRPGMSQSGSRYSRIGSSSGSGRHCATGRGPSGPAQGRASSIATSSRPTSWWTSRGGWFSWTSGWRRSWNRPGYTTARSFTSWVPSPTWPQSKPRAVSHLRATGTASGR